MQPIRSRRACVRATPTHSTCRGAALAATVALLSSFQQPAGAPPAALLPITGNVHERAIRIDPATGLTHRLPASAIANGSELTVYDNTCLTGYFLPLRPPSQNPGATEAVAFGDWGALPSTAAASSTTCTPGSADTYAITSFTIAYCTTLGVPLDAVLHFWNGPQDSCTTPFTGTLISTGPPPTRTVHTTLPRSSQPGFQACYTVQVDVGTPGFQLDGGSAGLRDLALQGDRFAWSFQITNALGNDGPILAGGPATGCGFCVGTIWEAGGQTANPGFGLGQANRMFLETFGGSWAPSGDCYTIVQLFPGTHVWAGGFLELDAIDPRSGTSFCDGSDGSLAACPCANPGTPAAGCDNAQGTGGVAVALVAQTTSPTNGVTLSGTGFPTLGTPTAIVLRSNALDPAAPIAFGDGVRCLASPLVRLAATNASGGTSTHAFGHGAMAGTGTFYYQLWYRNTPSTFCDPDAAFNLSNGVQIEWP